MCRSPHGARRNAGKPLPHFALLHAGYESTSLLSQLPLNQL
jgi:hypothetical protein